MDLRKNEIKGIAVELGAVTFYIIILFIVAVIFMR